MPLKGIFTPHEKERVQLAINYIHDHYTDPLSADGLVEEARLDKKLFYLIFIKLTGLTVHNYVVKIRLERAIEDLADFSLNVGQVAYRHGFSTAAHFSRKFKEQHGIPPTEYRFQLLNRE